MSLPGLGLSEATNDLPDNEETPNESRTIALPPGSEWRFEVPFTTTTTICIQPSSNMAQPDDDTPPLAEIYGTELVPDADYTFSGTKAVIYSHDGCRITISGECESDYIADETPMTAYMNVHFALEHLRATIAAARARTPMSLDDSSVDGPRVLVVGPDNAGKTSLVKLLTTYATRCGRSPAVVNLDPREGMFCLPGSVSAAVFGAGSQMDVENVGGNGWGTSPVQGGDVLQSKMPIVYHYGCERVEELPEVFKPIASRLALAVTSRFEDDEAVKEAGILVDLSGTVCTGKGGYDIIHHVVSEFSINIMLILGSERVYSDMSRKYASPPSQANGASKGTSTSFNTTLQDTVTVLKLPKSGGCVDRSVSYTSTLLTEQAREYFYGTKRAPLSPHSATLDLASFTVLRMIDEETSDLTAAFLPGGSSDLPTSSTASKPLYTSTTLDLSANNTILTLKHAGPGDEHEVVRDAPVLGYLYVAEVDVDRKRVRVLSPVGGRLPERAVVWGRWPEGVGELG